MRSKELRCITVPNFIKISQSTADILQLTTFQDGGGRHVEFQKFSNFIR